MVARPDRRELLRRAGRNGLRLSLAVAAVGAALAHYRRPPAGRPLEEAQTGILRPPGALDEPEFLASCVRCTLCADVCETNCIRLFGPTEGRVSGTPYIVAEERGCNGCLKCTQVCPSGSLTPLTELTEIAMGTAVVDERLCVSHNGTGVCGACHTACPVRTRAITQGSRNAPTVHDDACIGCGMCEEVCIVDDRKAIRVVTQRSWS